MKKISERTIIPFIVLFFLSLHLQALPANDSPFVKHEDKKELYLPDKIGRVPEGNDFNNNESEFSFKRSIQSDNMALFWSKEYGDDPMKDPVVEKRFDVNEALAECERFYEYYTDVLKIVKKGHSISDKYKVLIIVFGGDDNTAYGGGAEDKVGVLWTPATRINKQPFGVLAHELGHTFQFLARIDNGGVGPRGPFMEMSAQYLLWQVYPEWMTFENYHLVDYLKQTYYAYLHPANTYHSPYVIEYWSEKHGKEFYGKLLRATHRGEDPVMTYKRMNSLTQAQFNDEMYDACARFITWDMDRIRDVAAPYANKHYSKLIADTDGWYKIAPFNAPRNYGYNGIKLNVPKPGSTVVLNFEGIAGAEGYHQVKLDKAGWHYGFVAYLQNGKRVYGEMQKDQQGKTSFKIPDGTQFLWLVVMGAPTEHWSVAVGRRNRNNNEQEEQWSYKIKLEGTTLADDMITD